jgi:hypothetical protein
MNITFRRDILGGGCLEYRRRIVNITVTLGVYSNTPVLLRALSTQITLDLLTRAIML